METPSQERSPAYLAGYASGKRGDSLDFGGSSYDFVAGWIDAIAVKRAVLKPKKATA